jgi:hypothetical protein
MHTGNEGLHRWLNQVYTQHFNRRHQRVGHVLQGRYKAIVVDNDSYFTPSRRQAQCGCLPRAARARPSPEELLAEVAKVFDLPRHAVLDRRHVQGVSLCGLSAAAGGERTDRQGGAACRNIRATGLTNSGRGGKRQAARADAEAVGSL